MVRHSGIALLSFVAGLVTGALINDKTTSHATDDVGAVRAYQFRPFIPDVPWGGEKELAGIYIRMAFSDRDWNADREAYFIAADVPQLHGSRIRPIKVVIADAPPQVRSFGCVTLYSDRAGKKPLFTYPAVWTEALK